MTNRLRVIGINLAVTAGLLLTLEVGSRLLRPVEIPDPLVAERRSDWKHTRESDPLLFWRMKPDVGRGSTTLTNSLGLRGPEVPEKTAGEFRILSLGESTTFGIRLPLEETYSARLERGLEARLGRSFRVINAGVPGYSLFQGVTYLKHRGLELAPDAVLIYFGYNDYLPIAFRVERDAGAEAGSAGATDRELFQSRQSIGFRLLHELAERSNFARYLMFEEAASKSLATAPSRPRVPERDRRDLLAELRDLADEHQIRLAIVVPWYREFDAHEALLREFASEHGIPLVDLPERLGAPPGLRARYFVDPIHPNSEGHERIAAVLTDELIESWGLQGLADPRAGHGH